MLPGHDREGDSASPSVTKDRNLGVHGLRRCRLRRGLSFLLGIRNTTPEGHAICGSSFKYLLHFLLVGNLGRQRSIIQRFKSATRRLPRAVLLAAISWLVLFLALFVILSFLSGSVVRFVFGGSDQTTSNFGIYFGAVVGAAISVFFFGLAQSQKRLKDQLDFLTQFYEKWLALKSADRVVPPGKMSGPVVSIAFFFLVTFALFVLLSVLSGSAPRFVFGGSDQATSNFSLFISAVIGSIISIFFFWLERRQGKLQEQFDRLAEAYIVRTCVFNLRDVFAGYDHAITPNDAKRTEYVDKLAEYVRKLQIEKGQILSILELARSHQVPPDIPAMQPRVRTQREHQEKCPDCRKRVLLLEKYLNENPNPGDPRLSSSLTGP